MYSASLANPNGPTRTEPALRRWMFALVASATALVLAGCAVPPSAAAPLDATPSPSDSVSSDPLPDPAKLAAKLATISRAKIDKVSVVVSTTDGTVLTNRAGTSGFTPASTMKLVTTMAAIDILGTSKKFATTVVATDQTVILVGGGDPLLTDKTSASVYKRASLQKLAAATVTSLKASGRTSIKLGYDSSLFSGPTFSPHWRARWKGSEARVAALEINSGKLSSWRADPNPPKTATAAFAKRLRKAGIAVSLVGSVKAPTSAGELARVESTTVPMIIKRTLLISDNVAAETLSRHAALARGKAGSFTGAAANVTAWLKEKGLWASGEKILDGSGLSPSNRLTTMALTHSMRTALDDSTYLPVVAGLPVAWETGTLSKRFNDKSEKAGRHNVHAKTGTLRGVAGLVGYLTTREGTRLVFAELANTSKPVSYNRLYNWLDRTAAATITCACR